MERLIGRKTCLMAVVVGAGWMLAACPDEPAAPSGTGGEGMVPPPAVAPAPPDAAQAGNPEVSPGAVAAAPDAAVVPVEPGVGPATKPGEAPPVTFDSMPMNAVSQDDLKKGNSVVVRGTLSGEMCAGRRVRLEAQTVENGVPSVIAVSLQKGVGAFDFYVPKGLEGVYITAMCDANDNGAVDVDGDYIAANAANPVKTEADVAGIQMKFEKGGKDVQLKGLPLLPKP